MINLLNHNLLRKWWLIIAFCFWGISCSGCNQETVSSQGVSTTGIYPTSTFLPTVMKPVDVPSQIMTINLPLKPTDILINAQTGVIYILVGGTHVAIFNEAGQYDLIPLGGTKADKMALDDFNNIIYVAHDYQGQESITIIQGDKILSRLNIPLNQIKGLTVHPETHELYIIGITDTGENKPHAEMIVTNEFEILKVIDLGEKIPERIAIDPIFKHVYIGGLRLSDNHDSSFTTIGTLTIVSKTGEVQQLELGQAIVDIGIDQNTGNTYVLQIPSYENEIRQDDLTLIRDNDIIASIQVADGNITAKQLRIHPTTSEVYIINPASEQVSIVRNTNDQLEVVGNIHVGSGAEKLAIDPITQNVYIANFNDDTVSVLNGNQAISTLEVGWYPYGIAVDSRNGWVYVSNTNERTVSVLGYDD